MNNSLTLPSFVCSTSAYGIAIVIHAEGHGADSPGCHSVEMYFWNASTGKIEDARYGSYQHTRLAPGFAALSQALEHANRLAFAASAHPTPCFDAAASDARRPFEDEENALSTFVRVGARAPALLKHVSERTQLFEARRCCEVALDELERVEERQLVPQPAAVQR
jgi:hypothetical protein